MWLIIIYMCVKSAEKRIWTWDSIRNLGLAEEKNKMERAESEKDDKEQDGKQLIMDAWME